MSLQDLKLALRSLLAHRGFLVAAILTLALGIGANTTIFSVVNGLLLKPLPYVDGERLVQVYNSYPKSDLLYAGSSIPDYLDRRQAAGLEDLALYTGISFNLADAGAPQRLVGIRATPSLFSTLRAAPQIGRVFGEEEGQLGKDKVVVLSHDLWQRLYNGDSGVIGREVRFNGETYRVLGVMPAGFTFPRRDVEVWVPFAFTPEQMSDEARGHEFSESVGRMRPGVTAEQLDAQFAAIVRANADRLRNVPDAAEFSQWLASGALVGKAKNLREQWVGDMKPVLLLLQAVVGLVLLIACANVANLLLTRLSARQKELSVRAAMGAGRWRILKQLLTEALLLALAGGVAGVLLAYFGLGLLTVLGLDQTQLGGQISIDASVLLFTLGVTMLTGVLFGTLPALGESGDRAAQVLRDAGRGSAGGRAARRLRNVLVVLQLAMAVSLLVGAGLLLRSFFRVQEQSPGFDREGVLTLRMALPKLRYAEAPAQVAFYERLVAEVRAIPGVTQAGVVSNLPFSNDNWTSSYEIEGRESPPGQASPHGYVHIVDDGYFQALGIPLKAGRYFDESDRADAEREAASGLDAVAGQATDTNGPRPVHSVIIDELLAKKHFEGTDPIGKRFVLGPDSNRSYATIVGVVGTVKHRQLSEDVTKETYYYSLRQRGSEGGVLVVKSALDPAALIEPLRKAVLRVDPEQPVFDIKSLDQRIQLSLEGRTAPLVLLLVFAALALLLAAVGIYGVLAFAVQQRTGELGVRIAIGAQRADVLKLVLGQGMRLTGVGMGLGVVGALLLATTMQSQLFGVQSADPLTLAIVIGVLSLTALLACWLPARRAASVTPLVALRAD